MLVIVVPNAAERQLHDCSRYHRRLGFKLVYRPYNHCLSRCMSFVGNIMDDTEIFCRDCME
jgi:hypothetical protein